MPLEHNTAHGDHTHTSPAYVEAMDQLGDAMGMMISSCLSLAAFDYANDAHPGMASVDGRDIGWVVTRQIVDLARQMAAALDAADMACLLENAPSEGGKL